MNERTEYRLLPKGLLLLLRMALVSVLAGVMPASVSFMSESAWAGTVSPGGMPDAPAEVPSQNAGETSVVVQLRAVDLGFPVEATVEAVRQATVAAQIAGRVMEIRVDAGQRVKQGELLMQLDAREAAGSDASARASLAQASAAYERTKNLHDRKFVSQAALDQAAAAMKAAQGAAVASGAGLSHGSVTAPIAGLVAQRHVEPGEMAAPGRPLITVFDPKGLRVIASLPQYKLADLKKAVRARIEFPETGRWIDASRVEILPTVDPRSHTATARLYLPENIDGVVPGSYARAHFTIGQAQKLTVPPAAVLRRGEVTAVYVLDAKNGARLRQVRLGEAVSGGELEVLAGINSGERISLVPLKAGIELKTSASH
ncbi:efflux RND transporter periplasmic adaptor subunit [Sulfuritalea hydrogenivorans]|jgi:RND family efflux transporter MFP subunit|uniref:RND family efflux transporter, MFP subunit n=1 Tax=Sulfuritalea hydrogenivorans sk43H TaxID=1223802 RepID=W0SLL0_9PROT|nr:efflux RND transporter periplasmic adaptor subunit [Sulfuritalea hydrogenivorans]MDK9714284.1 efflux RND transporter periplasmic adaptor subunit [Sulfuritalea sp.]BAO30668.1 RND family efflux transporter, MFP subunit [Sulfuritalea hydrogenivorans sk43H]